MYIRPGLKRKRSMERSLLEQEHMQEMDVLDQTLERGEAYARYKDDIQCMERNLRESGLDQTDTERIQTELQEAHDVLRCGYQKEIAEDVGLIEYSVDERVAELEEAEQFLNQQELAVRDIVLRTEAIHKEPMLDAIHMTQTAHQQTKAGMKETFEARKLRAERQREEIQKKNRR